MRRRYRFTGRAVPSTLGGFTEEQLDEVSPLLAELVDWE